MLVNEVLSRPMRDRRAVARYAGLTGAPDADSDEVAWAFRYDVARDYEMISPGFGALLA